MKILQIILLILIVARLGLIFTQRYWLQPLTDFILANESQGQKLIEIKKN